MARRDAEKKATLLVQPAESSVLRKKNKRAKLSSSTLFKLLSFDEIWKIEIDDKIGIAESDSRIFANTKTFKLDSEIRLHVEFVHVRSENFKYT